MNNLIVKYHNVDIEKIAYLIKKETEIVDNIQNEILNMPALNITYNDDLLNQAIVSANDFSKNKNHFKLVKKAHRNLATNIVQLTENEAELLKYFNNRTTISNASLTISPPP